MAAALHGLLNVQKPAGLTSMQVISRVRRWSGQRRVGHAGTLDPLAAGVLPIGVGQGTRVLEFFDEVTKEYRATIEFGRESATYDAEGPFISEHDVSHITRAEVERALDQFHGVIQQRPPMYSAIKHQGEPLYRLARRGVEVERPAREVVIHRLDIMRWDSPRVKIEVEVGRGLYLRSLAHDLGESLGCGAYLQDLVRTRSGPFQLENAVSLESLEEALIGGRGSEVMQPIDEIILSWQAVVLNQAQVRAIERGQPLYFAADRAEGARCRAYDRAGVLVALLRFHEAQGWRAFKVFPTLSPQNGPP
jgi:tRNA pseudouridine55 synthase